MIVIKFIFGLLLLPACWVSIETFFLLFHNAAQAGVFYKSLEFFFFFLGVACGLVLFLIGRKKRFLMWFYVAGHELTHALFALIFRGRVSKIHITPDGGHILTNRNNFIIALAPYFFPFYTILLIPLWGLLEWQFFDFTSRDFFWLYGLIGFTWLFHTAYTIVMLKRRQTDVEMNGKVFSFSVILLVNMLVISSLLILSLPGVTFQAFGLAWIENLNSFVPRLLQSFDEILNLYT